MKKEYYFLILIILIGLIINFYPHFSYPYPLHVDEWNNLASSKAVQENGLPFPDPFTGEKLVSDSEAGFHILIAEMQSITGIDWNILFIILPSLILILLIFSAYLVGSLKGAGMESAFFMLLIPTTLRLLGPKFLVAVSLAGVFFLLSLYLIINHKQNGTYPVLFLFFLFLMIIHLPSAIILAGMIPIYVLINYSDEKLHCRNIIISVTLALIAAYPIFASVLSNASNYAVNYLPFVEIFEIYSIPIIFFILGIFLLAKEKEYLFVSGAIALLILIAVFTNFKLGFQVLYDRAYFYLFILMGLIGAYALSKIKQIKVIGKYLFVASLAVLLIVCIYSLSNENYYHLINNEQYSDFNYAKENLDGKFVLDPVIAKPFSAISGKYVYSYAVQDPSEKFSKRNNEVMEFFNLGCNDTDFLIQNNISFVYGDCSNSKLIAQGHGFYSLA